MNPEPAIKIVPMHHWLIGRPIEDR